MALKVLPEAFAGDAERMVRFQREAEVLASLSHPTSQPSMGWTSPADRCLVMELVPRRDMLLAYLEHLRKLYRES